MSAPSVRKRRGDAHGRRRFAAATVLLLLASPALAGCALMNRGVVRELEREPDGARAEKVLLLTLPSGKRIPVNYLRKDDTVYAAADFPWWRQLREEREVTVLIRGETLPGRGRAIRDDPALRDRVFDELRPTPPRFLGTLIEIRLAPGGPSPS